ncbi:MAG: T9SS type A sorting domain-containing protein [Bacteroidetes bacterium]|nr:T9SS type A sorting domain-containing protein [Bacteroidota bacterium]
MRQCCLFVIILTTMVGSNAQISVGTCPIPDSALQWTNESATSLGLTSFGGRIDIFGSFTVNVGTFTFFGAEVGVLSDGDIIVNPGCTLRVFGGSIITNVQELWNGITVLPGGRLEVDESDICGAVNAVYINNTSSTTPGQFDIRDSGLHRNVTGIWVSDYALGTYPGYVVGTHFEGGTLPVGSSYTNSVWGVNTLNISGGTGLTIGVDNTLAAANRFTRMDYGVYGLNSSLQVFNNEFEDIQDFVGSSGYAVYSTVNSSSGPYSLAVGTSITKANTMLDCRYGIYSRGMKGVVASDNTMNRTTEPFVIGVWITRTADTIVVRDNTIRNFSDAGIILDENPGPSGGPVDANVFNNTLDGSFAETRGILVDDLVGEISVWLNDIDEVHRGIIAQSLLGATKVRIDSNTIQFGYAGISMEPAVGILAVQAEKPLIFQNTITGNCPYSGGGGPCTTITSNNARIRGIQLIKTHDAVVFTNYVEYCGAGLYIFKDNFGGNAVCNEFHDCFSGVVWDDLGTGEFGVTVGGTERVYGYLDTAASSDNRWTTSLLGGFEPDRSWSILSSDAGSVDWYYRNAATYDFPTGTNILFGGLTLLNSVSGSTTAICDSLAIFREGELPGGEGEGRAMPGMSFYQEAQLDAQISAPNSSEISPSLYAFLAGEHRAGNRDPKVKSVLSTTNIAAFSDVSSLWAKGLVDSALALVQSLSPINTEEELLQKVWELRLNTESNPSGPIWSDADRSTLLNISYRELRGAGTAAVLAQSMLGITHVPDEWLIDATEERLAIPIVQHGLLYPNPAQTVVYFPSSDVDFSVEFSDLQGRVHLVTRLGAGEIPSMNINSLPDGNYTVRTISASGVVATHKLLIAR